MLTLMGIEIFIFNLKKDNSSLFVTTVIKWNYLTAHRHGC